ncbi:rod shape-determining protein MreC [uncultured Alistipes sp.]|uniref:rod shape-determining protein MreC n=1 Tax=uncultured Alistipes sp. TaxID=538949 RepID=UPI0026142941|nr:rod shape-determining protein MreC [uncultured Alistipes sp.]
MHKLFEFIRSVYVAVLFIVLEIAAVSYYARSTYYTQARLLTRSNQAIGGVHSLFAGVRRYFSLGHENRLLAEHCARLEEQLAQYQEAATTERLESYLQEIGESKYRFATACVVANTVNRAQNLITLNRGRNDNVIPEMGVLSPDGAMVGYVVDCSDRYAVAMSVLNTSFRASGRLAGSEYYGSIYWDGRDQSVVILGDVSKYADPQPGEEVVTTGFSQYFPADVLIGWVESAELNETRTAYTVRVRLAAELSRLSEVILVANRDLYEIRDLQQSDQIEQHTRLE